MFDFKFTHWRIFWDIFFFVLYGLIIVLELRFDLFETRFKSLMIGCLFSCGTIGSLLGDLNFKRKKIKPTVRTIGLYVLSVFFFLQCFEN